MCVDANHSTPRYLDMPAEIRMLIIDEMEPDDRCRFIRCSKVCYKEATNSKHFIHSLEIYCLSKTFIELHVKHGESYSDGYQLKFIEKYGFTYMTNCALDGEELWRIDFGYSVDLVDCAFEHFKNILHTYQRNIRRLYIAGTICEVYLKKFDFGVNTFNRLEELMADDSDVLHQFILKTKRPLKALSCVGNPLLTSTSNKIFNVSRSIYIPHLKLPSEDFLRLSASHITMNIGNLSVKNIFNFIKLWQSGKIGKNLKRCEWILDDSDFNEFQLFRLLGGTLDGQILSKEGIQHHEKPRKIAEIHCRLTQTLVFTTRTMKKQKVRRLNRTSMEF